MAARKTSTEQPAASFNLDDAIANGKSVEGNIVKANPLKELVQRLHDDGLKHVFDVPETEVAKVLAKFRNAAKALGLGIRHTKTQNGDGTVTVEVQPAELQVRGPRKSAELDGQTSIDDGEA